jgi:hypothetical protein
VLIFRAKFKNIPILAGLLILLLEQEVSRNDLVALGYFVLFQYYGIGNVFYLLITYLSKFRRV